VCKKKVANFHAVRSLNKIRHAPLPGRVERRQSSFGYLLVGGSLFSIGKTDAFHVEQ
jgi:hypothetical protein